MVYNVQNSGICWLQYIEATGTEANPGILSVVGWPGGRSHNLKKKRYLGAQTQSGTLFLHRYNEEGVHASGTPS